MKEKLKNLKIRTMLTVGIASVALLATIVIIASIAALKNSTKDLDDMYQQPYAAQNSIWQIRREIVSVERMLYKGIAAMTDEASEEAVNSNVESAQNIADNLDILQEIYPAGREIELVNEIREHLDEGAPVREEVNALILANENEKAYDKIVNEYAPIYETVNSKILELAECIAKDASAYVSGSEMTSNIVAGILIVCMVMAILFSFYMIHTINAVITEPLEGLMTGMHAMSEGDFETKFAYEAKNEFGELSSNFRHTRKGLKEIIGDLNYLLDELYRYNFNVRSQCTEKYVGEFEPLLLNFRNTVVQLSDTIRNIGVATEQVDSGSAQLATSAQTLAEGATEQAGAVEELLATTSTLMDNLTRTADQAHNSYITASQYAEKADRSKEEMKNMVATMTEISETSKKIQGIIGEIEDIASQTNLLSLNASIEAARAGEAGRGFAVVADQIGKLAEESAKSAQNTRELIMNALQEIEQGSAVAQQTASSIDEVVVGVNQVAEESRASSEECRTQAEAMKEAEEGVNQISVVVEMNSATSEETAATSQELEAQATSLKDLVSRFTLRE